MPFQSYQKLNSLPRRFFVKIWGLLFWEFPDMVKQLLDHLVSKHFSDDVWNFLPFHKLKDLLLTVAVDNSKFLCPIQDIGVIDEIYDIRVYDHFFEPEENFKVVDVGGHVGIYAVRAGRKVGPEGLVLAIEPDPFNYRLLVQNIQINRLERTVIPFRIALADFNGESNLYLNPRFSRGHSLMSIYKNWIKVQVRTLDSVMDSLDITHCDILKIDVEGGELEVLKGAEETLKRTRMIAVAAYHTAGKWEGRNEVQIIKSFLQKRGFKTFIHRWDHYSYVYAMR